MTGRDASIGREVSAVEGSEIERGLALLLEARVGSAAGESSLRELIDDGRHT